MSPKESGGEPATSPSNTPSKAEYPELNVSTDKANLPGAEKPTAFKGMPSLPPQRAKKASAATGGSPSVAQSQEGAQPAASHRQGNPTASASPSPLAAAHAATVPSSPSSSGAHPATAPVPAAAAAAPGTSVSAATTSPTSLVVSAPAASSSGGSPTGGSDGASRIGSGAAGGSLELSSSGGGSQFMMPRLPPRQALPAVGPVLDPDEPDDVCEVRRQIHEVRVTLIRAAQRLGSDHENALVKQVLYRLKLAEKLKAPWRGRGRRPEPERAAARDAARREALEGPEAVLDFKITVLLVGVTGVGKTQLINSLMGSDAAVDAFDGGTRSVRLVRGTVHGMRMVFIDTPGLQIAASRAAHNARTLRTIAAAYKRHNPDLVLYVDRMDTSSAGRPEAAGELLALQELSLALGPASWLNTIIALSHAGSSPQQGVSYDVFAHQRCTQLQKVIRAASGDERLMNPVAFVDSHPGCRTNAQGQPIVGSGIPWKPHFYLMIVAAKLLADTEEIVKMKGSNGSNGQRATLKLGMSAAAMQQVMAAQQRQMPLPYIVQQAIQSSRPLEYPGHDVVMSIREGQRRAAAAVNQPEMQREMTREVRARLRQARASQKQAKTLGAQFRSVTLAGGKVVPEPPRLARRATTITQPAATYRYRVPEATNGWVVRPHIEQHGLDNTDGIEGIMVEKTGVIRPATDPATIEGAAAKPFTPLPTSTKRQRRRAKRTEAYALPGCDTGADILDGVPFHHFISAQCGKQQCLLQGRTEATLYHDPHGRLTTSLSADGQTTGAPGSCDALVTLRSDTRRARTLWSGNTATIGMLLTRLIVDGRPHRGPFAYGARLQDALSVRVAGAPVDVKAATCLMMSHTPGGMVADERCVGTNVEATIETQGLLRCGQSAPLTVNFSSLRYKGNSNSAVGAMLGLRGDGKRDSLATRFQMSNSNRAAVTVRAHSGKHWRLGLIVAIWPLSAWLVETTRRLCRRRKAAIKAAQAPALLQGQHA